MTMRVSFSALLRIKEDDRYVLFHTPNRPGSYSPPGGAFKYYEPATGILERAGFRPDRYAVDTDMRRDLRGFIPESGTRGFLRWLVAGAYREDATECLRRELHEELAEVGLPQLTIHVDRLTFRHVRTVTEGPNEVPGQTYRQLRRFEIHDLVMADGAAFALRLGVLAAGNRRTNESVICVTEAEIRKGRQGVALIGGHTGYLVGHTRTQPDLAPLR